jgi:hypothetical protein
MKIAGDFVSANRDMREYARLEFYKGWFMEYLGSAFVALAVLLVVVIAAFSFEQANPLDPWLRLIQSYATQRAPSNVLFPDQDVRFGNRAGSLKSLSIAAKFDATIDDFGFWLTYKGPLPEEMPDTIKVPGTHVRFVEQKGNQFVFDLFAEPPVKIGLRDELGGALMERCQPAVS